MADLDVPGTFATIAVALAASNPADEILLTANITENVNLTQNIAAFKSDTGFREWNASGGASSEHLQINTQLTQLCTLRDLAFRGSPGVCLRWSGTGTGSQIIVEQCDFQLSSADGFRVTSTLTTTDQLIIRRCKFSGGSNGQSEIRIQTSGANTVRLENILIIGNINGTGAIRLDDNTTNNVCNMSNITIADCSNGLFSSMRSTFDNFIFTKKGNDISFGGSSSLGDLNFSAFQEEAGPFGTGNIFGIVPADEFINEAADDYHLKDTAQTRNTGIIIPGIIVDLDGKFRPVNGMDMGCFENENAITSSVGFV